MLAARLRRSRLWRIRSSVTSGEPLSLSIRPVRKTDAAEVVRLSLAAWEPIFESFRGVLGPRVYGRIWPEWRSSQASG